MRIVIDMQGCLTPESRSRGVGRYTINFVDEIFKLKRKEDEVFLLINDAFPEECFTIKNRYSKYIKDTNFILLSVDFSVNGKEAYKDPKYIGKLYQLILEAKVLSLNPDVIWSPNLQEGFLNSAITSVREFFESKDVLWVSTLHDVTPLLDPTVAGVLSDKNPEIKEWYYNKISAAGRSDIVLTDSEFSKNKIIELCKFDGDKIKKIYPGISFEKFKVNPEKKRFEKKDNFLFYLGSLERYKNINIVIEAYLVLPDEIKRSYPLVLAGFNPDEIIWKRLQKKYSLDNENIKVLGRISDGELIRLLQSCKLFIYPSIYEGFGYPAPEAMACGALTLSADSTSLTEVSCSDKLLFDPYDKNSLVEKIKYFLSEADLANQLIEKGIEKAYNYDNNKGAKEILDLCRKNVKIKSKEIQVNWLEALLNKCKMYSFSDPEAYCLSKAIVKNFSLRRTGLSKAFIDVTNIIKNDANTGIQRVVKSIAKWAITNPTKSFDSVELVYAISSKDDPQYFLAKIQSGKIVKTNIKQSVDILPNDYLIFCDLDPEFHIFNEEFYKKLKLRGIHVCAILYDLIPVQFPSFFDTHFVQAFTRMLFVFSNMSIVICDSNDVKEKYKDWLIDQGVKPQDPFRIESFYLGCDLKGTLNKFIGDKANIDEISKFSGNPFYLVVSTVEPRKKHIQIIKAFEYLNCGSDKYNLVFVGSPGWKNEKNIEYIEELNEKASWFHWFKRVDDLLLNELYKKSKALINASLEEGFGLPIVEAAYYKKPLILRDIPVFKEIAKDEAYYFSGEDPMDIARLIRNIHRSLCDVEYKNMRIIDWKESTCEFLSLLK